MPDLVHEQPTALFTTFFLDTLRVKIGMYVVVHCVSNANLYHTLDVNIELYLVTRLHVQYQCSVLGGTVMLSMPGLSYLTELLVHGHSSTGMQGPAPFQPMCQDYPINMLNKSQNYNFSRIECQSSNFLHINMRYINIFIEIFRHAVGGQYNTFFSSRRMTCVKLSFRDNGQCLLHLYDRSYITDMLILRGLHNSTYLASCLGRASEDIRTQQESC